jgi:hypothetical protein
MSPARPGPTSAPGPATSAPWPATLGNPLSRSLRRAAEQNARPALGSPPSPTRSVQARGGARGLLRDHGSCVREAARVRGSALGLSRGSRHSATVGCGGECASGTVQAGLRQVVRWVGECANRAGVVADGVQCASQVVVRLEESPIRRYEGPLVPVCVL